MGTPLIEVMAFMLEDDEKDLDPLELLLGRAEPTEEQLAAYAEDWRQEPPRDEFANLLNATDE